MVVALACWQSGWFPLMDSASEVEYSMTALVAAVVMVVLLAASQLGRGLNCRQLTLRIALAAGLVAMIALAWIHFATRIEPAGISLCLCVLPLTGAVAGCWILDQRLTASAFNTLTLSTLCLSATPGVGGDWYWQDLVALAMAIAATAGVMRLLRPPLADTAFFGLWLIAALAVVIGCELAISDLSGLWWPSSVLDLPTILMATAMPTVILFVLYTAGRWLSLVELGFYLAGGSLLSAWLGWWYLVELPPWPLTLQCLVMCVLLVAHIRGGIPTDAPVNTARALMIFRARH